MTQIRFDIEKYGINVTQLWHKLTQTRKSWCKKWLHDANSTQHSSLWHKSRCKIDATNSTCVGTHENGWCYHDENVLKSSTPPLHYKLCHKNKKWKNRLSCAANCDTITLCSTGDCLGFSTRFSLEKKRKCDNE